LVEPIQGEAGVIIPDANYLPGLRELCTRNNALLIVDEIQSGLGRTGETFACDLVGVKPDLMTLGKALGGGIMPVSAVVGRYDVLSLLTPGTHGSTFGGNPLACAVALGVIDVLETGEYQANAKRLGAQMAERLDKLVAEGQLQAVRHVGLWAGIDIDPARGTGHDLCEALMAHGVLAKDTHGSTIRLAPPLSTTDEELTWMLDRLEETIREF
jgi:ornithine--oxo-acid transaminase